MNHLKNLILFAADLHICSRSACPFAASDCRRILFCLLGYWISNTSSVLNTNLPCNATHLPFLRLCRLWRSSCASASSRRNIAFSFWVLRRTRVILSPNRLAGDVKRPAFLTSELNNDVACLSSVPSSGELFRRVRSRLAGLTGERGDEGVGAAAELCFSKHHSWAQRL